MNIWKEGELNPSQEKAVLQGGNVFVIACPGSGKTRTLAHKIIAELSNVDSHRKYVIAITYTNRAADEISDRIEAFGIDTSQLWIGTIHSFCLEWVLRPYAIHIEDLKHGFRVINSHDSEEILTELCKEYKAQKVKYWDCGYYFTRDGYTLNGTPEWKLEYVRKVFAEYFRILSERRQVDYELILYYSYRILSENPAISKILANIFPLILVDEYQDTKEIQYDIISLILSANPDGTNVFFVGDPNQAIYETLGGFAIEPKEMESRSGTKFHLLDLELNYRSSSKIIDYYKRFAIAPSNVVAASEHCDYPSLISFCDLLSKDQLEDELIRTVLLSIEVHQIDPNEICILAPWWVQLASMTRRLVARLPQYPFDGPGTIPFARDPDNFWYRISKVVLTEPSPKMYIRRLRWAKEILGELDTAGVPLKAIDAKSFLRICNSIEISENDGLLYLQMFFDELFNTIEVDISLNDYLKEHYDAFFSSSKDRIAKLEKEGQEFIAGIDSFRKVFKPREGITVSSIHGIKGGEFDVVIAYALLENMVPHFSDPNGQDNANRMLYVIGSRARKNLFLFSEKGRVNGIGKEYVPTRQLAIQNYQYDNY